MSATAPGFTFPGSFEISAMGPADAGLEQVIPALLAGAGLELAAVPATVRPSRAGNYVSVTVRFIANNRSDYEAAHTALRAHPDGKWTL